MQTTAELEQERVALEQKLKDVQAEEAAAQRRAWQSELADLKAGLPAMEKADKAHLAEMRKEEKALLEELEKSPAQRLARLRQKLSYYHLGGAGKEVIVARSRIEKLEKLLAQPEQQPAPTNGRQKELEALRP